MKKILLATTKEEPGKIELANRKLARSAAAAGMVLLENDGMLPLKEKKIALYGSGARMTVKGGTGSGAVRERYSVSIYEGLKEAGFDITTEDWLDRFDTFYNDSYEAYRQDVEERVKGVMDFYKVLGMAGQFKHPTGIPVEKIDYEKDQKDGVDTAIYVLARQAGEGNDRKDVPGDYGLEEVELNNLKTVAKEYKNVIVIINAGGVIDVSFMDELSISALVYFVQGGEEGGNALADLLSGKENFSGKLTTGWAYHFADFPSNTTYSYLGENEYEQEYNEGIYVGYRYFDSFDKKPRYPFGYG
nr:glycoside hydrolase family 3 C-terminal domain-containing protein [Lachnospiraceae bacterium]